MDRKTCRQQLFTLLNETLAHTQVLRRQLEDEAAALTANDVGNLESAVAAKNASVHELEQREQQRQRLLETAGFSGNRYGTNACIEWCDEDDNVARLWQQLLDDVQTCQRQNRVNGTLVQFSRRHVQQLLDILRGQLQSGRLYDPSGDTSSCAETNRTLAKA
jgi:flagellar biosynthesis/type III secretory pathway chaperone